MVVCGRRWKMLAGVVTGAVAVAMISLAAVGTKGCLAWIDTLRFYGRLATGPVSALRRTKYVDLGSFFRLVLGDASTLAQVLAALAIIAGLAVLALAWWQSSRWSAASRDLLWASTIAGALALNVYTPIYDTILVGAAAALGAGVMLRRGGADGEVFGGWMVLLYIVPWVTQSFAEFLRFQPYTLVLAGFAGWMLWMARRGAWPACQAQYSSQHALGPPAYAGARITGNSWQCLSVLLRGYSLRPALLWERDR
jgi:hypothetical protein